MLHHYRHILWKSSDKPENLWKQREKITRLLSRELVRHRHMQWNRPGTSEGPEDIKEHMRSYYSTSTYCGVFSLRTWESREAHELSGEKYRHLTCKPSGD